MPYITLNAVGHTFRRRTGRQVNDQLVLDDINLSIERNEFVTVIGASGCGKTTLLRIIAGLLEPTSGTVTVGDSVRRGPGRDTSFVFQNDSLLPWKTVRANVEIGLAVQGRKRSRDETDRLLKLVGLEGFADHYPHELSGGMRQRVNLIRALATHPELLLMDEPFAALDAQTREVMQQGLMTLWNTDRKTVVFITHQIDEAIYLADRVLVLAPHPGRLIADVRVDFPRPRELPVKRTPEFMALADELWDLIRGDVFKSENWALAAPGAGMTPVPQ
ncbi:ABC transporter ATP-binding protein [Micromonospora sp. NPDC005087]|uniref:ABC transporter ATP-binding protein n=1 Tax=Micromonospora sp. NPDC005087 TaxID=3364225 RepID=UPI003693B1A6